MNDTNADLIGESAVDTLLCTACGEPGAADLGDDVLLCRACSGEDALAEAREILQ